MLVDMTMQTPPLLAFAKPFAIFFFVLCCVVLYPGHGPEDIRRYPGHMTRDTVAVISWVICPGILLISLGHVANHQICRLITANNRIT